jgi:hypothetical protein
LRERLTAAAVSTAALNLTKGQYSLGAQSGN